MKDQKFQSQIAVKMLLTQNPLQIMKIAKDNEEKINAYIKGDIIEGYNDDGSLIVAGLSVGMFLLVLVLAFGLFIWNIVAFMKYKDTYAGWSIAVILLLYFMSGGIASLIAIYLLRNTKNTNSSFSYGHGDDYYGGYGDYDD